MCPDQSQEQMSFQEGRNQNCRIPGRRKHAYPEKTSYPELLNTQKTEPLIAVDFYHMEPQFPCQCHQPTLTWTPSNRAMKLDGLVMGLGWNPRTRGNTSEASMTAQGWWEKIIINGSHNSLNQKSMQTCMMLLPPSSRAMPRSTVIWKILLLVFLMMRSITSWDAPSRSR